MQMLFYSVIFLTKIFSKYYLYLLRFKSQNVLNNSKIIQSYPDKYLINLIA